MDRPCDPLHRPDGPVRATADPDSAARPVRETAWPVRETAWPTRETFGGLRIDLHIHSVLSPCAERDMTPGNIVSMAMLLGLDVIAVTDHQSCGNCGAVMAASAALGGPLVIPGMEVESAEEIHLLCLFPNLDAAQALETDIRASQPCLPNRVDIFGEQWLMDENDERIGEEPRLLLAPCALGCDDIAARVLGLGGVCIPAHLDREANSMLVSLGAMPPEFPTDVIEISGRTDPGTFFRLHPELARYRFLVNSDAHALQTFAEHVERTAAAGRHDRPQTIARPNANQLLEALRPACAGCYNVLDQERLRPDTGQSC